MHCNNLSLPLSFTHTQSCTHTHSPLSLTPTHTHTLTRLLSPSNRCFSFIYQLSSSKTVWRSRVWRTVRKRMGTHRGAAPGSAQVSPLFQPSPLARHPWGQMRAIEALSVLIMALRALSFPIILFVYFVWLYS